MLRNSCFKNIHTENKLTVSADIFTYLCKDKIKKLITLLSRVSEVRLFKLLQDYNGAVCSDTECSFKHKTIIHFNYVVLQKDTLFWVPSINTSCFAEKLPYDHTELHHSCPALASKAPASYHHWDTTHALTCKHRLCVTALYVPQHRT